MMSLKDKDTPYTSKQQTSSDSTKPTSSNSRQWSGLNKNPRIVRVSRTFGGKDRHSKVCTIKGLRDRRIRLSVPTAIQLYDLQERLGLNQPSKVIDWLLDTTKHDIDKLPPLPMSPEAFTPFHQTIHGSQGYGGSLESSSGQFLDANLLPLGKQGVNTHSTSQGVDVDEDGQSLMAKLKYWDSNVSLRSKQKVSVDHLQGRIGDSNTSSQVLAQNFFPIASGSASILPSPTLLNSSPMLNYYNFEPSNLSLTQSRNHGFPSQNESSSTPLPSSLSLSSYPSTSLFPPYASLINAHHPQEDNEPRQFNRFHFSNSMSSSLRNSTSLGLKPFPFSMNHHPHLQQKDHETHQNEDDQGV